jgi:hypothetical protein
MIHRSDASPSVCGFIFHPFINAHASSESRLKSYRRIDVPANIPYSYELGEKAAELQMRREHLTTIAG